MSKIKLTLITLLCLQLLACGKKNEESADSNVDSDEAVSESAVTALSGSLDDQAGSSFAYRSNSKIDRVTETLQLLFLPTAVADACIRAVDQACVAGVRSTTFSGCTGGLGLFSRNGSVTLTYSDASCALALNGDSVTRTYDYTISGPRGGVLSTSSDNSTDYNGNTYGGGGRLTVTASGWDLEVLGKHKVLSRNGNEKFNISMRTTSPIGVSGSLGRASRVLDGGSFEINHNLAEFTATFTPSNLTWNNTCCHPVSGSLSVSYSGSKTGSATLTFTSCGQAELDKDGVTKSIELNYCE